MPGKLRAMSRIRLSSLVLAAGLLLAGAAQAAVERPRLDVLGFSADGRFFAYKQSGLLDENGDSFAALFVMDTTKREAVKGTPMRVVSSANLPTLTDVRTALESQSSRLLQRLGLRRALAGVAFVPKYRDQMWLDLPWGERVKLQLTARNDLGAPGCPLGVKVARGALVGFHLTMQRPTSVEVIHNDRVIPRGRGCPVSYRFASGFIKSRGDDAVIAALIAYREPDSDGSLRTRYTAITAVVNAPGDRVTD